MRKKGLWKILLLYFRKTEIDRNRRENEFSIEMLGAMIWKGKELEKCLLSCLVVILLTVYFCISPRENESFLNVCRCIQRSSRSKILSNFYFG